MCEWNSAVFSEGAPRRKDGAGGKPIVMSFALRQENMPWASADETEACSSCANFSAHSDESVIVDAILMASILIFAAFLTALPVFPCLRILGVILAITVVAVGIVRIVIVSILSDSKVHRKKERILFLL